MKKYLHYIRKYVENFGFVNRVVWLSLKYYFFLKLFNSKYIMRFIESCNKIYVIKKTQSYNQKLILSRIEKVLNLLPINISCILKSIIIHKYLKERYNVHFMIRLGVDIENNGLIAHSWLKSLGDYDKRNFKTVY